MPIFRYRARDRYGTLYSGTIEMAGRDAVATQLDHLGYIPIRIAEERPSSLRRSLERFIPIRLEEKVVFTRQLATLIGAGIPFIGTLDALLEQTGNLRLRRVIEAIRRDVTSGMTFSDALGRHSTVFDPLFVSMVQAGETGGMLDDVLERLAAMTEHDAETRARIRTATRYPKIVLVAFLAGVVFLMSFVVPRFAHLYDNFHAVLPLPTRILIGANTLFRDWWPVLLLFTAGAYVAFRWFIGTPFGRVWWDGVQLKVPVFGTIVHKASLSRFARVFAGLIKSGLPMLQALEVVTTTVGNVVLGRSIERVREAVLQGRTLSEPMRVTRLFPAGVIQMVSVGEETGRLDQMLVKVSDYYDRQVDYMIKNLTTLIEPLMLAVMGGAILFLALAILMPWWNLINVFRGGGG